MNYHFRFVRKVITIVSKHIVQDIDGYYYLSNSIFKEGGLFSSHSLDIISAYLKKKNKPWDDYISKNIK
jgi:hypothetical protein